MSQYENILIHSVDKLQQIAHKDKSLKTQIENQFTELTDTVLNIEESDASEPPDDPDEESVHVGEKSVDVPCYTCQLLVYLFCFLILIVLLGKIYIRVLEKA